MFENLTLLAAIISLFWVGALVYYLYTSRQQRNIREDLDALNRKLQELEERDR